MDKKWLIGKIIAFIGMIIGFWQAYSEWIVSKSYQSDYNNKSTKVSENIELEKQKLGYYFNDSIEVIVQDLNLIFTMKQRVTDRLLNYNFSGYDVSKVDYTNTKFGVQTLKLIENQIDKYFINNDANNDVYLIVYARGLADGVKVKNNTFYRGEDILGVEYYKDDDINLRNKMTVNFINGKTCLKNEYFAVLRAYFIVNKLQNLYPKTKTLISIKEYEEISAQYRGCDLRIEIKNAYKKKYEELGWGARKFIEWGWAE